jgi:hypothetical protein
VAALRCDDWRYAQASVPGVAHHAEGRPCQDACAVRWLAASACGPVLLLAAADGAGSAAQADLGATLACQALLDGFSDWLRDSADRDDWQSAAPALLARVQATLDEQARRLQQPLREFACTLLGAALADDRALLLQIGDGAIILGNGDDYRVQFWPQAGEYANETYFVTDTGAAARLECVLLRETVAEIALLTDGLQWLALHYPSRQAHAPFFRPLFRALRAQTAAGEAVTLNAALAELLTGPAICARTHDDKTLILATRRTAEPAAERVSADAATPSPLAPPVARANPDSADDRNTPA